MTGRFCILTGVIALPLALAEASRAEWTWTTLDHPNSANTTPLRIAEGKIVGYSYRSAPGGFGWHGFLYENGTWTSLDYPGCTNSAISGISGNTMVGTYMDTKKHGFIYDGANWSKLDYPGEDVTSINDIAGGLIVGSCYSPANGYRAFTYDGATWRKYRAPGYPFSTTITGAWENKLVGNYLIQTGWTYHGFLLVDGVWTILDYPGATTTSPSGVYGNYIVGTYKDASGKEHGFLYDGSSWTSLDHPNAKTRTSVNAISGNYIVGTYDGHGFLLEIPEPSSVSLGGFALSVAALWRRRRLTGCECSC